MEWLIFLWLGIIILTIVLEATSYDLISIWFSAGALVSMILAIIDATTKLEINWVAQVLVFVIVSLILILSLRPVTKKYLKRIDVKTNIDTIVGKHGIVVDAIESGERGTVKVDGVIWTAISNDDVLSDEKVEILAIEGNKLIVKAIK